MQSAKKREQVIFIFIDGFGLDHASPYNPLTTATMPFMQGLINGPLLLENCTITDHLIFKGVDACLGVEGYPQSATGQTALFTGINAPQYLGYHYPAFPNEPLIKLINEHTILKKAIQIGRDATFANAYTEHYFELEKMGRYQHSATTLSVLAAGIPFRMLKELRQGQAVYWDITNKILKEQRKIDIDIIDPAEAGRNLVRITESYDLVLFETFATDIIGHKKSYKQAAFFLTLFDQFIASIFKHKSNTMNLVICSDHGNVEDLHHGSHTKNPALLFAAGPKACAFQNVKKLTDISGIILDIIK